MKIAVNTRFLIKNKLEGIGWFTYETLKRVVQSHPEHDFYFLFDRQFAPEFVFAPNVHPVVLFPPARHPFLWYWWFEFSVAKALKKIQPALFISTDGFLSLSAKAPTLLVIHDLAFEHYPQFINRLASKYYRHFTPLYCHKAQKIVTVSEASKKDIIDCYKINPEKITVAYNGAGEHFKPLNEDEKTEIKNHYSDGKNYFVYAGSLHPRKNIANLFKAFDEFKQQRKSDYKLVIAGARGWMLKEIDETLNAMRHKEDVVFTGHLDSPDLAKVTGSAFAMVYVSLFEGFGIPVVEAMKCEIPAITSNLSSMPEVTGDAGLLVNPHDISAIANAMVQLYSDKNLRTQLVEKGKLQSAKFSWDSTAATLWQTVEEMLNNR